MRKTLMALAFGVVASTSSFAHQEDVQDCRQTSGVTYRLNERADLGLFFSTKNSLKLSRLIQMQLRELQRHDRTLGVYVRSLGYQGDVDQEMSELAKAELYIKCLERKLSR